jgi:hypothetical protein
MAPRDTTRNPATDRRTPRTRLRAALVVADPASGTRDLLPQGCGNLIEILAALASP